MKEGKILGLEEVADDFAVEYLGAEYVIQGFRELIETTRPLEDADDFEWEQYKYASEELEKRIERINQKFI